MKKSGILCMIFGMGVLFLSYPVEAKRSAPKKAEPVVFQNIKYLAPAFTESNNHKQLSGYIEAWDTRANKKLWELKIYDIKYDPGLEKDVQEIYITSLRIEYGKLIVTNEAGEEYEVELATKKVTKRSGQHFEVKPKPPAKNSVLVK